MMWRKTLSERSSGNVASPLQADSNFPERLSQVLIPMGTAVDIPLLPPTHPLSELLDNPLKPAAVLVPLIYRQEWRVVLTERNTQLAHHAGQISFPGGRQEPDDGSFARTALRESHEEIGLEPDQVTLLGYLKSLPVITGFGVVPVVGTITGNPTFQADPSEVETVFEVPLRHLSNPDNFQQETLEREGRTARFHVIHFEQWRIWGATAAMLFDLATRIRGQETL